MPTLIGRGAGQVPVNGFLGRLAFQDPEAVDIKGGHVNAQIRRNAPATKTASFAVGADENWIICAGAATLTITLPSPGPNVGREIMIKTVAAFAVVSASSNVVPLAGVEAGTAILSATAGTWATLVSDGTNWVVMQGS